jgi:hypothetical protein
MVKKYVDVDELFKCETCFHHKKGGCDTWCESGESYRPSFDKLKIVKDPYEAGYRQGRFDESMEREYGSTIYGFDPRKPNEEALAKRDAFLKDAPEIKYDENGGFSVYLKDKDLFYE